MAPSADSLRDCLARLCGDDPYRIILSKPADKAAVYRRTVLEKKRSGWQAARYTEKQVFHENLSADALREFLAGLLPTGYLQLNAWSAAWEYTLLCNKKGHCTLRRSPVGTAAPEVQTAHDRTKRYLLAEGTVIPPLVDMGVLTPDGRVVKAMHDKFRQINRFLEIIDDALRDAPPRQLNIIDFGCGKSYLTFIVYYYLTAVRGVPVQMVGLDLKADVIEKCNAAARKYGYDGLRFEMGNINGYAAPFAVDMVLTLHACDTATDYALYNALQWGARMIFSVPCCQHELNAQFSSENDLLGRYGIIQERFCALATDALRARALEYCGYKTQLLEFIDFAGTPKNLLIRAVRRPQLHGAAALPEASAPLTADQKRALAEMRALTGRYHFDPTLLRLLGLTEQLRDDPAQ